MVSEMKIFFIISILYTFSFDVSFSDQCLSRIEAAKVREQCSNQLKKLCVRHDLLFKLWDSSSRLIHSGLTATNNLDLGNFDLCMTIDEKAEDTHILGKYCSLQWGSVLPKRYLEEIVVFLEENNPLNPKNYEEGAIQNNVVNYDTGSTNEEITIVGSICIPDECTPEEFTKVFNPYILPVAYNLQNASTNCLTKDSRRDLSTSEIIITIVFCAIFLIVVGTTVYHVWLHNSNRGEPHNLIKAFSVLHNGTKLIEINRGNPEQIQCIHGLKFLSMLWVIAGHTFGTKEYQPSIYEDYAAEWKSQLYSQYIQAGPFAVDTFFFLSGLLLAYGYMKQMKGVEVVQQIKAIPLMILNRYLRLTPAIAALYFITISFLRDLGNGPTWMPLISSNIDLCKKCWWKFFLYVQNYNLPEICYIQTWYLSADMQMFVLAPVVLIPAAIYFRKNLRLVISSLVGLIIFCVGLTIAIRYLVDGYSNDYDTHSRLSNYLVGIIGGIIMHTLRGKDVKINKIVNLGLWILTIGVMLFLILYFHDILQNPTEDKNNLFYPIQRPIWSACILWIVFSCHHGYGGIVNKFLTISFFQIGSKLSYCMYVVHIMVIYLEMGSVRTYVLVNDYTVLYILCGNIAASMIVATLWTLAFEAPMIILNKMILAKLGPTRK